MKKIILHFSIIVCLLGINYSAFAQPTPLGKDNFPKNGDSLILRTNHVSPVVSFSDTTNMHKKDTLTIKWGLYLALVKLGDDDMKNVGNDAGANKVWDFTTFRYSPLPTPKIDNRVYRTCDNYTPGVKAFPGANLFYYGVFQGTNSYVFYKKDETGFYELGAHVLDTSPFDLLYSQPKPMMHFPVDFSVPTNVPKTKITSTASSITSKTEMDVTVDAWGLLKVTSGSPTNHTTKEYNCLRTVTHSIDTTTVPGIGDLYTDTKIYSWYTPEYPEPIISYSYQQSRNNVDPSIWSYAPDILTWMDIFDVSFITTFKNVGINEQAADNLIQIYPNPSNGSIFVVNKNQNDKYTNLQVSDILGKTVYTKDITGSNGIVNIDLTNQVKGLYLLKLSSDNKSVTRKLLIK